jgi:Holliday junction resolvasome RuvABC endonuclease subunit
MLSEGDMAKILGMDISLNHGAIVELVDGELSNFWYYTSLAGSANISKRGYRIDPAVFKFKDKLAVGVARLEWIEKFLQEEVLSNSAAEYSGIEDYALRAEQGSHQLGEAGGVARLLCYKAGLKLRLHDPISTKMFVAHDGTCQKDAVQRAVERRWGVDFSPVDQPPKKSTPKRPNPKQNKQTSEDLSDAFAIAQLVWTEVQLRSGKIIMSDLHEKEVRVFNRTTKTYPLNLLGRDWIYRR